MATKETFLFYGAGAIGSIFAGMIGQKKYPVTVLARVNRMNEISSNGIVLKNVLNNKLVSTKVRVVSSLEPDDIFDYIIVVVQNNQIDSILPILAKNKSHNIVFIVNNPLGYKKWIDYVGYTRILIGFPSAGGERSNGVVNYFIGTGLAKLFQSTTFGELNGNKSPRLKRLVSIFKEAGFSPTMSKNMDSWQKTHVAVITPIGKALYRYNSNNYLLSKSYSTIRKMILATRECFSVLKKLNIHITPFKLNFYYLPLFLLVPIYMFIMHTKIAEYAMAKHTIVAKEEMAILENQFRSLISKSGLETDVFNEL